MTATRVFCCMPSRSTAKGRGSCRNWRPRRGDDAYRGATDRLARRERTKEELRRPHPSRPLSRFRPACRCDGALYAAAICAFGRRRKPHFHARRRPALDLRAARRGRGSFDRSLWRVILANLPQSDSNEFDQDDLPKILPWLAPALVSDKAHGERLISEGDPAAHKLQAFFGMPRRIALRFAGDGRLRDDRRAGPAR